MKMSTPILWMFLIAALLPAQNFPYFDGTRAMSHLEKQCEFGPRYPGSQAHEDLAKWLEDFIGTRTDEMLVMYETVTHPMHGTDVKLTNLVARFNPEQPNRILFLAHWDTREIADRDPVEENRSKPILGANDGASGVAVLLTLIEILEANPVRLGVDLLFVDGEDMGVQGDLESWGLGTRAFSKRIEKPFPRYAVCVDMVGDAELSLPIEPYSYQQAPGVIGNIWSIAAQLGFEQYKTTFGKAVLDDHRVLWQHTKIPAVDIIDFDYPNEETNYWHTLEDTPDKCSAESLEAVGMVLTTLIYLEDAAFQP